MKKLVTTFAVIGIMSGCASAPRHYDAHSLRVLGPLPTIGDTSAEPTTTMDEATTGSEVARDWSMNTAELSDWVSAASTASTTVTAITQTQPQLLADIDHVERDFIGWVENVVRTKELPVVQLVNNTDTRVFLGVSDDIGPGLHFSLNQ